LLQLLLERNTRTIGTLGTRHLHAVAAHRTELIHTRPRLDVYDVVAVAASEGINLDYTRWDMFLAEPIEESLRWVR
jgi:hypothetical protein